MKNILIICSKELKSYFASPIAYRLMAFFALIFGYFFYVYVAIFVDRGMQSQMMGRGMPMDVNEWVIRPLLLNVSVIGLFLIPMITMRLFAEEKRSGHHRAAADIAGARYRRSSWANGSRRWCCTRACSASPALNIAVAVRLRQAGSGGRFSTAIWVCCCRADACWRSARSSRPRRGTRSSPACATFARLPAAVGAGLGQRV